MLPFQWMLMVADFFDAPGGTVRPGDDQIPGTSSDWNTVQNFVAVNHIRKSVAFQQPGNTAVSFGGFEPGKFSYDA
jgi:alpha-mannosidase